MSAEQMSFKAMIKRDFGERGNASLGEWVMVVGER